MNIATLIIESPSGKILIAKSKSFGDSFVLPNYEIKSLDSIQSDIKQHIENELHLPVNEVELIGSGEYAFGEIKSDYHAYLVRVNGELLPGESTYNKLVWMDPHKAIKLVFTEPFTLNIVDYLRKLAS